MRNILISPEMEKFKDPFLKVFGSFTVKEHHGSQYFETPDETKFCMYPAALGLCEFLGIRSEIALVDEHWHIKFNGRWYPINDRFSYISEFALNKARMILNPTSKLFLRWPIENPREPIVITDGEHAIMIQPITMNITKGNVP